MMKRIYVNSPVVLGFSAIALLSLLLGYLTQDWSTQSLFLVYRSSPKDPLTYVRIFGYVFGHGNFQHFFGNMSIMLLIGPMLEEKYGSKTLAIFMAITAFITGIIQITFFSTSLLGASGIVFMMILMSSFANFKKGQIPLTLILIAALYLGQEIISGFTNHDNISQMAHIAGGLIGACLGYWINMKRHPETENSGSTTL